MIKACIDCFTTREQREQVRATGRTRIDGKIVLARPAPCPGPRCVTHGRIHTSEAKVGAHDRYVQRVYGLGPGDYGRIYEFQGGVCILCQRSKGLAKRLAVDHDHQSGLAFGLLCGPCNKDVMGWSKRDPQYFLRCIGYLNDPPARQLGIVAIHEDKRKEGPNG